MLSTLKLSSLFGFLHVLTPEMGLFCTFRGGGVRTAETAQLEFLEKVSPSLANCSGGFLGVGLLLCAGSFSCN